MIINLNLTQYMASADQLSEIQAYAEAVDSAIQTGRYSGPLTTTCPECESNFADLDEAYEDTEHIIIATTSDTTAVIVGCEGYFMVNPNLVGLSLPNWHDADGNIPPVCVLNPAPDDLVNGDISNI
jgi:hypothetical protein